jgi:maltooligosyltrehalose trehalohydrolase
VIRPRESGGFGLDAQWCDDYHHCIHTLLTGELDGYYIDFGKLQHLVKSIGEGFVYSGEYSEFRKRNHGNSSKDRPADQFVVFSQNHDQTGNRMLGERLTNIVSFESLKLAAGIVLLSPYIPLLFMGEEYGEEAPFVYFISHSDPTLIESVRKGRKEEFKAFQWQGEPLDPQDNKTFLRSKITWEKRESGHHKILLDFYKHLITLRKTTPALSNLNKQTLDVEGLKKDKILCMRRWTADNEVFCIFNLQELDMSCMVPLPESTCAKMLDSSDSTWNGPGSLLPEKITTGEELTFRGLSFAMYRKELQ